MIRHDSQRGWFAYELHRRMKENKNIWLVVADLGYKMFDDIKNDYPDRFLNTGASEQAALDICSGLALSGKLPVFYTITPFILRGFETLRLYINYENLKVIMVGGGRDYDYKEDGISHHAHDIPKIMATMMNTSCFYPINKEQVPTVLEACLLKQGPSFINLRR